MSIQIKLKNSVVQDSTPSTSDLPAVGEIALNANINSIGGFMRASNNTIVKIFGPGSVTTPTATTTVPGIAELATSAETTTGSATNRVVTPAGLNAVTVAERTTSNNNYVAKAGGAMTGVLTIPAGTNSAPGLNFGDTNSGLFAGAANNVSLTAGGTTRLVADTTGIAVTGTLAVTGAITSTSDLTIADKIIHAGDTDTAIRFPGADIVTVETAGSENVRFAAGRLLLGTSAARSPGSIGAFLQIEGTSVHSSSVSATRNSADNAGPNFVFNKTRGTDVGADVAVIANDQLGRLKFCGNDGTDSDNTAAAIDVFVDGTPGTDDMPGRLVFSTSADGTISPTPRLTIDSAGLATFANAVSIAGNLTVDTNTFHVDSSTNRIGVGTTSPAGTISLNANNPNIRFDDSDTSNNAEITLDNTTLRIECNEDNAAISSAISFRLDGSEKASIDAAGLNITQKLLHEGDNDTFLEFLTDTICFDTGGSEAARIDLSQRLLVGISSARGIASRFPSFQIEGGNNGRSSLSVMRNSADNAGSSLILGKSRGTSNGSNTIVNDDDQIGVIRFCAADGTDTNSQAAAIAVFIDGTPGNNDVPGRLLFMTANDGSSAATEKMTIKADGKVGIGTGNPQSDLVVRGSTPQFTLEPTANTQTCRLQFCTTDGTIKTSIQGGGSLDTAIKVVQNSAEVLRLDTSGRVGIGTSVPASICHLQDSGTNIEFFRAEADLGSNNNRSIRIVGPASDSATDPFRLVSGNSIAFEIDAVQKMIIDETGQVGIGADPDSVLHISSGTSGDCELIIEADTDNSNENDNPRILFRQDGGSDQSSVGIGNNLLELRNGVSSGGGIRFMTSSTTGYANAEERMRVLTGGNVSIGSTASKARLYIKGSNNTTSAFAIDIENSDNTELFKIRNDGYIATGVDGGSPINHTGGSANVHINSNGRLMTVSSSKKYKEDITNALWGLAEVLKLRPVTFKYKTQSKEDKKYAGFTAEELHDLGLKDFVDYKNNQPDSINYPNMVALMAKAIQELNAKVTKLEAA